jgi:hypothetical protein
MLSSQPTDLLFPIEAPKRLRDREAIAAVPPKRSVMAPTDPRCSEVVRHTR